MILVLLPLLAVSASLYFKIYYLLAGIIVFHLVPGIYIALKKRKNIMYPVIFSIVVSIPFALIVDYIATSSNLWHVPQSLFPLFLGILPFEDYLWMVTAIFAIIMVSNVSNQEAFPKFLAKRVKTFALFSIVLLGIFFSLYFIYGQSVFNFSTPYLYLIIGVCGFGLPTLLLGIYLKESVLKYIPTVLYFLYLTLIFEATAIHNSWWAFNGAYLLSPLTIFGKNLPIEELFFAGIVGTFMTVFLYRFLSTSNRNIIKQ